MNGFLSTTLARATSDDYAQRTFIVFLVLHVCMWSLLPGLTWHELDSDSMKHFAWGQEWQWSYRHPPLVPWVVAGFLETFGINNWTYILLSQLNIMVAFVAIWLLARDLFSPTAALVAVCLLEFIPYYSLLSLRFNHNSVLISIWALTTLFAHYALSREKVIYWILLSLFAAGSMLGKYYSVTLLTAIALIFLFTARGRKTFSTPGPWIALAIFSAILAFHVRYVVTQNVGTISHIGDYFDFGSLIWRWPPIKFFIAQLIYFSPALVVFLLATRDTASTRPLRVLFRATAWTDSTALLYAVTLVPLIATTVLGLILGVDVSSRWGGPILGMVGILLLLQYPGTLSAIQARRIILSAFGYVILVPSVMLVSSGLGLVSHEAKAFPGKELALKVTELWHQAYGKELRLVGGGRVAPDSIAFHSPDHPSVLRYFDFRWSPWIRKEDIRTHGMAVVCLADDAWCLTKARTLFPGQDLEPLFIEGGRSIFSYVRPEQFQYLFVPPGSKLFRSEPVTRNAGRETADPGYPQGRHSEATRRR